MERGPLYFLSSKIFLNKATSSKKYFLETLGFKSSFWKKIVWKTSLFELLLFFITFVNCEGAYLVEGFLCNLSLCFDVVFEQYESVQEQEISLLK